MRVTFFRRHVQSKYLSHFEIFQGSFYVFFGDIESILNGGDDRQRNLRATFITIIGLFVLLIFFALIHATSVDNGIKFFLVKKKRLDEHLPKGGVRGTTENGSKDRIQDIFWLQLRKNGSLR